MEAPENIYLFEDDDGVSWAGDPAPSEGIMAEESIKYIRSDLYEQLQQENAELKAQLQQRVPESVIAAAKGAIDFVYADLVKEHPATAASHIKGLARLILAASPKPQTQQRVPDYAKAAIKELVDNYWHNTCLHEETHRGGSIWEICDNCGEKWADDEGGKPMQKTPGFIERAEAMLNAAPQPPEPVQSIAEIKAEAVREALEYAISLAPQDQRYSMTECINCEREFATTSRKIIGESYSCSFCKYRHQADLDDDGTWFPKAAKDQREGE